MNSILSAPLTPQQKDLYDSVISRTIRTTLMSQKLAAQGIANVVEDDSDSEIEIIEDTSIPSTSDAPAKRSRMKENINLRRTDKRRNAKRARKSYIEVEDDDEYFDSLDDWAKQDDQTASHEDIGREYGVQRASKCSHSGRLPH